MDPDEEYEYDFDPEEEQYCEDDEFQPSDEGRLPPPSLPNSS